MNRPRGPGRGAGFRLGNSPFPRDSEPSVIPAYFNPGGDQDPAQAASLWRD